MARFTTRVELRDTEDADYGALYEEMARRGFSREMVSSAGQAYHLPQAEYDFEDASSSKQDVLNMAGAAAAAVSRDYAILVTESNGRMWRGLKKV